MTFVGKICNLVEILIAKFYKSIPPSHEFIKILFDINSNLPSPI